MKDVYKRLYANYWAEEKKQKGKSLDRVYYKILYMNADMMREMADFMEKYDIHNLRWYIRNVKSFIKYRIFRVRPKIY